MNRFFTRLLPDWEKLSEENRLLREQVTLLSGYIRNKTNQLLVALGTLPLHTGDGTQCAIEGQDCIGILADTFSQILEHEQQLAERLRQKNSLIEALLTMSDEPLLIVDRDRAIRHANNAAAALLNPEQDQLRDKYLADLAAGSDLQQFLGRVFEARRHQRQQETTVNGVPVELSAIPLKDQLGEVCGAVLAMRKNGSEEGPENCGNLYRSLFDEADEPVFAAAQDGSLLYANRRFLTLLGREQDDIRTLTLWNCIAPESRQGCMEFFNQLMRDRQAVRFSTVFFGREGETLPLSGRLSCAVHGTRPVCVGMFRHAEGH